MDGVDKDSWDAFSVSPEYYNILSKAAEMGYPVERMREALSSEELADMPDELRDEAIELYETLLNQDGEDAGNETTREFSADIDEDGDTDITITEKNDGNDEKSEAEKDSEPTEETKDNSSEEEDTPHEEKLNNNVVNAVSEHRL